MRTSNNIINIIYFPSTGSSDDSKLRMVDTIDRHHHCMIPVFTKNHLKGVLQKLPKDIKVLLWIHIGHYSKRITDKIPINVGEVDALKKINDDGLSYISEETNCHFFTTGAADEKTNALTAKYSEIEYYSLDIFSYKNQHKLPTPQLIKDILPNNYKIAKNLHYINTKNNWRTKQLLNTIPEAELKQIIGTSLGEDYKKYSLQVLKPGFSGSFILRITAKKNKTRHYLLKVSKNKTDIDAESRLAENSDYEMLNRRQFIIANANSKQKIHDWHCLKFHFQANKITLQDFLKKNLLQERDFRTVLKKVLDTFQAFDEVHQNDDGQHTYYNTDVKPISGGQFHLEFLGALKYEGLYLKSHHHAAIFLTLKRIEDLLAYYPQKEDFQLLSSLNEIKDFLEKPESILPLLEAASMGKKTPTKVVHGDFHGGNVMVKEKGQAPVFIDFANVPEFPTTHAFLDIAKLSSDLDISVMPTAAILFHPDFLKAWMDYHKAWLHGDKVKGVLFPEIEKIYELNEFLLEQLIEVHQQEMETTEIIRQFHMIRLHYFLKAIGYNHESEVTILFLIQASLDILDFLKKT